MTATRSARRSASSIRWVTRRTVTPRSRIDSMSCHVSRRACGSRPVDSSSRIAILRLAHEGEGDREALLLAAGQVPVVRVALLGQPEVVDQRPRIGRIRVERREQLEGLADGHAVGQLALLELDADERPETIAIPSGVEPEDADRAAVGRAQTGDRLDGRRLAGAVRVRGCRRSRPPRRRTRRRRRRRGRRSAW